MWRLPGALHNEPGVTVLWKLNFFCSGIKYVEFSGFPRSSRLGENLFLNYLENIDPEAATGSDFTVSPLPRQW